MFYRIIDKQFPKIRKIASFGSPNSSTEYQVSVMAFGTKKINRFGMEYLDQIFFANNGIFNPYIFDTFLEKRKSVAEKIRYFKEIGPKKVLKKKKILKGVFNKVDELVNLGFSGFVYSPLLSNLLEKETKSLLRFNLSDKPSKLYLIVAPSGFGKTCLINELKYCGVKQIPKITTRPYRSLLNFKNLGVKDNIPQTISKKLKDEAKKEFEENYKKEVISLSNNILQESDIKTLFNTQETKSYRHKGVISIRPSKFKEKVKKREILGSHLYKGNLYGFEKKEFDKLFDSTTQYVFDICDLETALEFRENNKDLVEIIGIFPSLSFAGFGLEKRIKIYKLLENSIPSLADETN